MEKNSFARRKRDKAIILLLADSGIRRAEACALNWGDIDILRGLVRINKRKGKKYRTVVIGATSRRAILAYRRTVPHADDTALIQTKQHTRLSTEGIRSAMARITKRTGIYITPHALRRTFATLARRAGIDLLKLQALRGHASLDMTNGILKCSKMT